ncbi:putative arginine--tRNA ligase, cytoplasmic [Paramyrothecium foliicola]|nr:putative arginine--tRNA ligase, cytoplasmic [Paramyrothecium foliicola]
MTSYGAPGQNLGDFDWNKPCTVEEFENRPAVDVWGDILDGDFLELFLRIPPGSPRHDYQARSIEAVCPVENLTELSKNMIMTPPEIIAWLDDRSRTGQRRETTGWLKQAAFYAALKEERFKDDEAGASKVPSAYRRLVYLPNPDFRGLGPLILTSSCQQALVLGPFLWKYLKADYSIRVLFPAIVCGYNNFIWSAYGFTDTYFYDAESPFDRSTFKHFKDDDFNEDEDIRRDPISGFDANLPIQDPRQYFLNALHVRSVRIKEEWERIKFRLTQKMDCFVQDKDRFLYDEILSLGAADDRSKAIQDLERSTKLASRLLMVLTHCIDKQIRAWESFKLRDLTYFNEEGSPPGRILHAIGDTFADLRGIQNDLENLKSGQDEFNRSLELHLQVENRRAIILQQYNINLIQVISPPALAAAMMQSEVLPWKAGFAPWLIITGVLWALTAAVRPALTWHHRRSGAQRQPEVPSHSDARTIFDNFDWTPDGLPYPQPTFSGLSLESTPPSATSEALVRPVEIWRAYLADLISHLGLLSCEAAAIQDAISSTSETSLGDLALILPRLKLKNIDKEGLKKLAFDLGAKLPASSMFLAPWVDGIHLRMFFSPDTLPRILLPYINDRKGTYGYDPSLGAHDPTDLGQGKKKVIVEFSSPNMASDFDGNHLRSTLLGAFIANIYEAMGWNVMRLNYLGDWGKHIGLLAAGYERFGSEDKLKEDGAGHLLDVYAKVEDLFRPEQLARETAKEDGHNTAEIEGRGIFAERDLFFKRLEDSDETPLKLWERFRDITIEDLNVGYQRLAISFDEFSGESHVQSATINKIEDALKEKGVLEESEGSWLIDFAKHAGKKGLGTQIVRGRDGATRYLLRDIAAVVDRKEKFGFDRMLYVVSSRQDNHFQQVFTATELVGSLDSAELQHVSFGSVQGVEGNRLTTILDQYEAKVTDFLKEEEGKNGDGGDDDGSLIKATAISMLLAEDMSGKRGHAYTISSERSASSGFRSGYVLQKCYAKIMALASELQTDETETAGINYDALTDDDTADLLRILAQFPDVLASTYKSLEPHTLLGYLYKITDSVSSLLAGPEEDDNDGSVDDGDGSDGKSDESGPETRKAKLFLFHNTLQVLENALGTDCSGLWANNWVCVRTPGFTYPVSTTCYNEEKTMGGNKLAALRNVAYWCDGNARTDGSGGFTSEQMKYGCYNAPIGNNKIESWIRNDFVVGQSLPVDKCNQLANLPVGRCGRGGTGTFES